MNDVTELVGIVIVAGAAVVALWLVSPWAGIVLAAFVGLGLIGAANRQDGER